jgi:hypothetical protein
MAFTNLHRVKERLGLGALLLILTSLSCGRAEGEYELAKIDLDPHRSIEILASETMEVSQALYCQVSVDGKVVVPIFLICSGHDSGKLKFAAITAKNGELVGVFEQRFPDEILVLHDFSSNQTWPLDRFKSLEASERLKEELLQELQAEHNDLQLKTGFSRGCI